MHYGVKKIKQNKRRGHWIFTPNKLDLTFQAPNHCAKFDKNRIKIAAVGWMTDTLTDAKDFTICPMLRYSSGTDNQKTE